MGTHMELPPGARDRGLSQRPGEAPPQGEPTTGNRGQGRGQECVLKVRRNTDEQEPRTRRTRRSGQSGARRQVQPTCHHWPPTSRRALVAVSRPPPPSQSHPEADAPSPHVQCPSSHLHSLPHPVCDFIQSVASDPFIY